MSERLEEIKRQRQKKSTALDYINLDIDWLIKRSEKAEWLEAENVRLREALSSISMMCVGEVTHIQIKRVARQALEGES